MKDPAHNDNLDKLFNKAKAEEQSLDDFEKEALAGFDMLESAAEAKELKAALDNRIEKELFNKEEKNNPKIYWLAAAGLALLIGLSTLFVLNDNNDLSKTKNLAIANTQEESKEKQLGDSKALKEQVAQANQTASAPPPAEKEIAGKPNVMPSKSGADNDFDKKDDLPMQTSTGATSHNGPTQVASLDREKSERKKESYAAGENSNLRIDNNAANDEIDDLSKTAALKDGESTVFKAPVTSKADQQQKPVEDAIVVNDAKYKEKASDKLSEEPQKKLNQTVATTTSRAENKNSKKTKNESSSQPAVGGIAATEQEETKPGVKTAAPAAELQSETKTVAIDGKATKQDLIMCHYAGGEATLAQDLKEKLTAKNLNQKFDATLYVSETKIVTKVDFINSYDLSKKQKEEITTILKSLTKFDFFVSPTKKGNFPYKLVYRP